MTWYVLEKFNLFYILKVIKLFFKKMWMSFFLNHLGNLLLAVFVGVPNFLVSVMAQNEAFWSGVGEQELDSVILGKGRVWSEIQKGKQKKVSLKSIYFYL